MITLWFSATRPCWDETIFAIELSGAMDLYLCNERHACMHADLKVAIEAGEWLQAYQVKEHDARSAVV